MNARDETLWPWAPYDPAAPLEQRVKYLEARCRDYAFEEQFYERFLNNVAEMTHEIAASIPVEMLGEEPRARVKTLAGYWRWVLWEDCMANVPDQVERVFHALLAGAVWPP